MNSATTVPPVAQDTPPPRDRAYWVNVLHNAAQVPQTDPRYDNARAVIKMSLDNIQSAADSASAKNIQDISPGPVGTAAVAFGHGASLGLAGDPTYLQLAHQANPKTAFASDVAGTAALGGAMSPLVAGLTPLKAGAVIGGALGAGRAAIEPPFPSLSRAENAAIMGAGGAVTGGLLAKFVAGVGPVVGTIVNNVKKLAGFGAGPSDIAAITESAIRAQLAKLKVAPDLIEQAVQSWKTTGALTVKGMTPAATSAPPTPVAIRPGETLTQTSPRGFEVTGTRATPPVPTTPTIAEMQGLTTRTPVNIDEALAAARRAVPTVPWPEAPSAPGTTVMPYNQQDAARNAYNLLQSAGGSPADATAAARNAAGYMSSWDPRQALMLALLLGGGAAGKTAP